MKIKLLGLLLLVVSSASQATLLTSVEHFGATFSIDGNVTSPNMATFTYTADFSAGWEGSADYIFAIDFKIEGFDVTSAALTGTSATGGWLIGNGPSNANGCSNNGNTTFICAEDNPLDPLTGQKTNIDGEVTWDFAVTFDSVIALSDLTNAGNHIGAFFCDMKTTGGPNGVTSCSGKEGLSTGFSTTTTVPEPSSLILLGFGLFGLGLARRKLS